MYSLLIFNDYQPLQQFVIVVIKLMFLDCYWVGGSLLSCLHIPKGRLIRVGFIASGFWMADVLSYLKCIDHF